VQKQPLSQVLDTITKQTGVRFSYHSQLISPKTKVTINAENKTIKEIFTKILPPSISYKKVGEHIVFYSVNNSYSEVSEKNAPSDNGKPADDCLSSISATNDTLQTKDTVSLTREEENMKAQIAGLMMAVAATSMPIYAQDTISVVEEKQIIVESAQIANTQTVESLLVSKEVGVDGSKPFQLTFVYPLGTGLVKSAENTYHFSLNILGGVTGQSKGFEIGSIFNINKYGATGAQFAGIFNLTNANNPEINSSNAQFAGIFNLTKKGKSAHFAGIFNKGDTAYFQAAGIWSAAQKTIFQASGIMNIAQESKVQMAGIFNHSNSNIFQAAGIVNTAKQTTCQLAGIVNIAQESKCQLAGIVNVTKRGRFQMGLINIRDTADGISLGLINIVKKGGILEAGIEAGEFVHTAATFRSGVQRLYSIIYVGGSYTEKFWTVGGGLGTSFKLIGNLGLNLEVTHAQLYSKDIFGYYSHTKFYPVLNYQIAKHFKIYLGPSFNLTYQNDWSKLGGNPPLRVAKVPYSLYNHTINRSTLDMWIGIVGGIKF
jgi:hypothetical protein